MEIIRPNIKHLDSYYEACKIMWNNIHDNYIIHNPFLFDEWKKFVFQYFDECETGKNLPEGLVPSVFFWVIENDQYIGTLNIRLKLNESLENYGGHIGLVIIPEFRHKGYGEKVLEFAIIYAKNRGISPVMCSCQSDNMYSQKLLKKMNPSRIEHGKAMLRDSFHDIIRFYFS